MKLLARLAALILFAGAIAGAQDRPAIDGLDHINIAVADLQTAVDRYRALGFSLKPGAPHANGIQNQHVKFPDGTELELITAPSATDDLTTTYRRHLAQGDAPAFLAFFVRQPGAIAAMLDGLRLPYRRNGRYVSITSPEAVDYIFFGPRNHSPTDRPEHFAHGNTAASLIGVWLAGDDLSAERRLLQSGGATFEHANSQTPDMARSLTAHVPDGEILFLPANRQMMPGRKIVGATVRVENLEAGRLAIAANLGHTLPIVRGASSASIFIPPTLALGLWLELREPKKAI